jgi:cytochrome P450
MDKRTFEAAEILADRYGVYVRNFPGAWRTDSEEYWVFDADTCRLLLTDDRLTSKRDRLSKLAAQYGFDELAEFLSHWLMYTDEADHADARRELLASLSGPFDRADFDAWVPQFRAELSERTEIDIVDDFARPWASRYVLACCGLRMRYLAEIAPLIEPIAALPGMLVPTQPAFGAADDALARLYRSLLNASAIPNSLLASIDWHAKTPEGARRRARVLNVLADGIEPTIAGLASSIVLAASEATSNFDWLVTASKRSVRARIAAEAPFQFVARFARKDIEVHGEVLASGTRVILCLGAANRQLEDSGDLTFGAGRHRCLGERIALTCIEEAYEILAAWAPRGIRLIAEPVWTPSLGYRLPSSAAVARVL